LDDTNGIEVERNAFWLLGRKDDFYTIQQIKVLNITFVNLTTLTIDLI